MTDSSDFSAYVPLPRLVVRGPSAKHTGNGPNGCTCGKVLPRSVNNIAHAALPPEFSNELLALFAERARNRKAHLRTLVCKVRKLSSKDWNTLSSERSDLKGEDRTMALRKMYPDIDRHRRGTSPSGQPSSAEEQTDQTPPEKAAEPVTVNDAVNDALNEQPHDPQVQPTPNGPDEGQTPSPRNSFSFAPEVTHTKNLPQPDSPDTSDNEESGDEHDGIDAPTRRTSIASQQSGSPEFEPANDPAQEKTGTETLINFTPAPAPAKNLQENSAAEDGYASDDEDADQAPPVDNDFHDRLPLKLKQMNDRLQYDQQMPPTPDTVKKDETPDGTGLPGFRFRPHTPTLLDPTLNNGSDDSGDESDAEDDSWTAPVTDMAAGLYTAVSQTATAVLTGVASLFFAPFSLLLRAPTSTQDPEADKA